MAVPSNEQIREIHDFLVPRFVALVNELEQRFDGMPPKQVLATMVGVLGEQFAAIAVSVGMNDQQVENAVGGLADLIRSMTTEFRKAMPDVIQGLGGAPDA